MHRSYTGYLPLSRNLLSLIHLLKMAYMEGAILCTVSFSSWKGMLSGPVALFVSTPLIAEIMSLTSNEGWDNSGSGGEIRMVSVSLQWAVLYFQKIQRQNIH